MDIGCASPSASNIHLFLDALERNGIRVIAFRNLTQSMDVVRLTRRAAKDRQFDISVLIRQDIKVTSEEALLAQLKGLAPLCEGLKPDIIALHVTAESVSLLLSANMASLIFEWVSPTQLVLLSLDSVVDGRIDPFLFKVLPAFTKHTNFGFELSYIPLIRPTGSRNVGAKLRRLASVVLSKHRRPVVLSSGSIKSSDEWALMLPTQRAGTVIASLLAWNFSIYHEMSTLLRRVGRVRALHRQLRKRHRDDPLLEH